MRNSFDTALQIHKGEMDPPFRVTSGVQALNSVGLELERPYWALTDQEVMGKFQLPPEAFEGDFRSVSVPDEAGQRTNFWLFDKGEPRTLKFLSKRQLEHTDHLVKPEKMLRKEQPAERYELMCRSETAAHKPQVPAGVKGAKNGGPKSMNPWKLLSLEEAKKKAAMIIQSRETQEQQQEHSKPSVAADEAAAAPTAFVSVEKVETSIAGGAPNKGISKRPGTKGTPKAGAKTKRQRTAQQTGGEGDGRNAPRGVPEDTQSVLGGSDVGDLNASPDTADGLASIVKAKIGGDVKSIRNLDVARVLLGDQLGRSVYGVFWHD